MEQTVTRAEVLQRVNFVISYNQVAFRKSSNLKKYKIIPNISGKQRGPGDSTTSDFLNRQRLIPYSEGDSFFHTTEQLQLVLKNDHLNKTGHNSKTN